MRMKGSGLSLSKRECDGITFSLAVMRTKVITSFSLTHAEGGMASVDSASIFSF